MDFRTWRGLGGLDHTENRDFIISLDASLSPPLKNTVGAIAVSPQRNLHTKKIILGILYVDSG